MSSAHSTDDRTSDAQAFAPAQPARRSWAEAMKLGFRRDILIATLGFVFGSVIVGIDAAIPAQDEGVVARDATHST